MATNFDILDKAEKLELMASELYAAFAHLFGSDADAHALFERLRDEEQQHAARIRLLASQSRRDGRLLGRIDVDLKALDDALKELGAVVASARAGQWRGELPEAKQLLLALEERCATAHAHVLYQGIHESLRRFFEQLAAQDKAHEQLLRE